MKTTLSERDGNTVKLAVEVSGEELQEAFSARLRQLSREIRIPGFRPGKAPVAMVRQRLGDEAILADAVEESMKDWYAKAIVDSGLEPVDHPQIDFEDDEQAPELGKPLAFTATVTVMPELVLGEYKGVTAPRDPVEVEDVEVDAQMGRLREEFAELRPVTGRAVEKGDFVTADFHATLDGAPVDGLEASDYVFDVGGTRMFPEVDEQVVGMSAGEERTFPFALPEGFPDGDLGGKTVEFVIVLKEIKEKVLPPLTDQWTSEVSEFATLLELRQEIREKLRAGKAYASEREFRAAALMAAADNASIDLPDVVVRDQAEEMLSEFKSSLEAQGGSLEGYMEVTGISRAQMLQDLKPQAANTVKTRLVLDAVAKAEGIEAIEEEVTALVGQMAAVGKVDPKVLESRLRKSGRIEELRAQIVRDKAADLIAKSAVETVAEAAPAKPARARGKAAPAPAEAEPAPAQAEPAESAAVAAGPAEGSEADPPAADSD